MIIIPLLSCFFIFLIIYQLVRPSWIVQEGFDQSSSSSSTEPDNYKPYNINDPNTPLILAQQNASNIISLKKQVDELEKMSLTVQDLSNNYVDLYNQVQGLVKQQTDYATQLNGGSEEPIDITGTSTN